MLGLIESIGLASFKQANKSRLLAEELADLKRELDRRSASLESALASVKQYETRLQKLATEKAQATKAKNLELHRKDETIRQLKADLKATKANWDKEALARIVSNRQALDQEELAVQRRAALRIYQQVEEERDVSLVPLLPHKLLPSQPFVVVLIDGDGYKFTNELLKTAEKAGTLAAQRLRTEVLKYILDHQEIPPHSKIVVRVFYNGSGIVGERKKYPNGDLTPTETLMVKFTETHPLFDYMLCGTGKERADDKIRENFHLYISHSDCHATFLAICNDNGYARMLERYQHDPIAQAKIVLIEAGGTVNEVARLPFSTVSFPTVFSERMWDKPLKTGTARPQKQMDNASGRRRQAKSTPKPIVAATNMKSTNPASITNDLNFGNMEVKMNDAAIPPEVFQTPPTSPTLAPTKMRNNPPHRSSIPFGVARSNLPGPSPNSSLLLSQQTEDYLTQSVARIRSSLSEIYQQVPRNAREVRLRQHNFTRCSAQQARLIAALRVKALRMQIDRIEELGCGQEDREMRQALIEELWNVQAMAR